MAARSHEARLVSMSTLRASPSADALRALLRHVRPVRPLKFPGAEPDDEHLAQSRRHRNLCMALIEILRAAIGREHTLAADQFVYFDAANPQVCLAPDAFVKIGRPDREEFDSWPTWEEGSPDVAFEVLCRDTPERWTLHEKLRRYHQLGVRELFVFDVDAAPGSRLRVWDRIENDFLERIVDDERTPSAVLGLFVFVGPVRIDETDYPACIRLSRDPEGRERLVTRDEALGASEDARRTAEARVAELEAEIARLRRGA